MAVSKSKSVAVKGTPSSATKKASTRPDKITTAEMKAALLRSGYLLESRVETVLRAHGGYIEANPTYPDPRTGLSREYDVMAFGAEQVGPKNSLNFVFPVLIIECVNNSQPLAILTKEPMVEFLHREEAKMAGIPVCALGDDREDLAAFLEMEKYHHYCEGRVGTQFCSFVKKKSSGEWMATHEGSHFDSFQKVCDVIDYQIENVFRGWVFDGGEELINIEFFYPVIVLQGELYDARETKRGVSLRRSNHIQFRRSVATKLRRTDYQIDVIREKYLPAYLEVVDQEMRKTARLLWRHKKDVREAIARIADEASKAATAEQKQSIMIGKSA